MNNCSLLILALAERLSLTLTTAQFFLPRVAPLLVVAKLGSEYQKTVPFFQSWGKGHFQMYQKNMNNLINTKVNKQFIHKLT